MHLCIFSNNLLPGCDILNITTPVVSMLFSDLKSVYSLYAIMPHLKIICLNVDFYSF